MPSPRRKLSALERLDGNPTKKQIQESGIEAIGGPFVAEHLMDDAKAFVTTVAESMPAGVYARLDSFLLAAYGVAWAIHKQATVVMSGEDFDFVVTGSTGQQVPSPWIKIASQQAQLMASLGSRLGLDPTSRQALGASMVRKKSGSKFDGLIGGKGDKKPARARMAPSDPPAGGEGPTTH